MNMRTFCLAIVLSCSLVPLLLIIVSLGAQCANAQGNGKELYFAVLSQDIEQIRALIAKGADVNYLENGRPILGWAAQNGNAEVVTLLLKSGANPNIADTGVGHTPLMRAIETQQAGAILALLKAKADPNAKTPDGKSCLTMAVESHKPKVVQALIISGANVKEISADGESPALTAAQDGTEESLEIIRMLGKAGAELNASNAAYTPLTYAVEQGNTKLVRTLLEAGANPSKPSTSGRTPLSAASSNPEIFTILLEAKADPNGKNGSDETPLAEAIYNNQIDMVKLLLAAGADTSKAGPNGSSALEYAKSQYHEDIVALLAPADSGAGAANGPAKSADFKMTPELAAIKCDVADAARIQMILHGFLQEKVNAGTMSSEIFRTFGTDTEEAGNLFVSDPSKACRIYESLSSKYGVASPYKKLRAVN